MNSYSEFILFDFETFGLNPETSSIRSFGAFAFSPDTIKQDLFDETKGFYANIDPESNAELGRTSNPETEAWWDKQNSSVRNIFTNPEYPMIKAIDLVSYFSDFCKDLYEKDKTMFLCRGTHFDYAFLNSLAIQSKTPCPVKYFNVLDVRSMINAVLYEDIANGAIKNNGYGRLDSLQWLKDLNLKAHFSLHDCVRDALLLSEALGYIDHLNKP